MPSSREEHDIYKELKEAIEEARSEWWEKAPEG